MPKREIVVETGKYYHLYNRGVNKGNIFFSDRNYSYFLFLMDRYFKDTADILAYCLMPNHFHKVIRVKSDSFLKESLHPFLLTYSKAINREQDRVGPLFQGRYQVNPIDDDGYLLDCVKYIHLNPVKAKLVAEPILWKYSSYSDYVLKKKDTFVVIETVLQYFDSIIDFQVFTESDIEKFEPK